MRYAALSFLLLSSITASAASPKERPATLHFKEIKVTPAPKFPRSEIMIDLKFSPYMGANNFITAFRSVEWFEDSVIRKGLYKTDFGSCLLRWLELLLVYGPMAEWSSVAQHEIFGHGYRIRDLGKSVAKVTEYHVGWPFPYSGGTSGYTAFIPSADITYSQRMAIDIAGIESNYVFSREIKKQWMTRRHILGREALLYLENALAGTLYAFSSQKRDNPGHDIANYITQLNLAYPSRQITQSRVRTAMLLNLIDPALYYGIGANWSYILWGQPLRIPTFSVGKFRFMMPNIRTELSPFGIENYLELYSLYNKKFLYTYLRGGRHGNHNYYGAGVDARSLFKRNHLSLDAKLELWKQPKMALKLDQAIPTDNLVGILASATLNAQFEKFGLFQELGGKTEGFVPGQSLKKALIFRFGLLAQF